MLKSGDFEKNRPLTPEMRPSGSNDEVYWKCEQGHSWKASIISRVETGCGCAVCSGKETLVGFNDLESRYPEVAAEWDYEKNAPLLLSEVVPGSHREVYWMCSECGHSWHARVYTRTGGHGCPKCAGLAVDPQNVECVETGEVFSSCAEAAKAVGLSSSQSISNCCSGRSKSAKGLHFRYIE